MLGTFSLNFVSSDACIVYMSRNACVKEVDKSIPIIFMCFCVQKMLAYEFSQK